MTIYTVVTAILFALSFSLMIYFSRSILLKLATVLIVFFLANQIYFGFESMKGWPTEERMQGRGQLLWAVINEPSETDPGAIYMWVYVTEDDSKWYQKYINYHSDGNSPRALKMPYNKEMAGELHKAKEEMKKGFAVEVDFDSGNDLLKPGDGEGTDKGVDADTGSSNETSKIDKRIPRFKIVDPRDGPGGK